MKSETEIKRLADRVALRHLETWGFETAEVEAKPDHDGDAALFVTLHFRPGSQVADGRAYSETLSELRRMLQSGGDMRFPYMIFDYPDDVPPFEGETRGVTA